MECYDIFSIAIVGHLFSISHMVQQCPTSKNMFHESGKLHPIGLRSLSSRSSPSNPTRKGSPTTEWKRSTAWGAMAHGTSWHRHWDRRRVRSIEILILFDFGTTKITSFVCVKFSGLRYCDQQTYQDTCKRFFNPEFWTPPWEP